VGWDALPFCRIEQVTANAPVRQHPCSRDNRGYADCTDLALLPPPVTLPIAKSFRRADRPSPQASIRFALQRRSPIPPMTWFVIGRG